MIRRLPTLLATLAATALVAGCSTFTDADVVARVGDTELSRDDLDDLLLEAGASESDIAGSLPGDPVRQVITTWIREAAIGIDDADVAEQYAMGFEAAGVACPALLSTDNAADAEAAAARLDAGEDFATVFADVNTDPQLAQSGGLIGCVSVDQFPPDAREAPDVAALYAVNSENPVEVAQLPGTLSVTGLLISFRPFEDLSPADATSAGNVVRSAIGATIDPNELDVYVDSRYGTFDANIGAVVPPA